MTTTNDINLTEKERVEHTARSTPALQTQKKEQAKRARQADRVVQAPRQLKTSAAEERSIVNDPLASPAAAPQPSSASDIYTGAGFPPPGFAYYAAEAMSLAVQANSNAMNVYSGLDQDQYELINAAYQKMADSDQKALMAQASSALWGGVAGAVMGGIALVGGVYGLYRMVGISKTANRLTAEKNKLTADLGPTAKLDEEGNRVDEILVRNEDPAKNPVRIRMADEREKLTRMLDRQEELKAFEKANAGKGRQQWEEAVEARFTGEDGFLTKLENDRLERLEDDDGNMLPQETQDAVNARFEPIRKELTDIQRQLSERGALGDSDEVNAHYDSLKKDLTRQYEFTTKNLNDEKLSIQQGIDEKDAEIKKNEALRAEVNGHVQSINQMAQLGQAAQFGTYAAKLSEAEQAYQKNKAQQTQAMNEAIRQEITRQWSSLAQATDTAIQAYQSAINGLQTALRG